MVWSTEHNGWIVAGSQVNVPQPTTHKAPTNCYWVPSIGGFRLKVAATKNNLMEVACQREADKTKYFGALCDYEEIQDLSVTVSCHGQDAPPSFKRSCTEPPV